MKKVINGVECNVENFTHGTIELPFEIRDHKFVVRIMTCVYKKDNEDGLGIDIEDWEMDGLTIRGTVINDHNKIQDYLNQLKTISTSVGLINPSMVQPNYNELLDQQVTEFINGCKPEQLISELLSLVGKKQKTVKKKK